MYNFIKNNQKKFLAVFMVILMVVFILPSSCQQDRNPVVARIGDKKVYLSDSSSADKERSIVLGMPLVRDSRRPGELLPLAVAMAPEAAEAIRDHPETYMLLLNEARELGLRPQPTQVDAVMEQISNPSRDPETVQHIRSAVENVLSINLVAIRIKNNIKVSEPMKQHQVAKSSQRIKVNIVDYRASDFFDTIGLPTPEQLTAQFDAYGDADPAFNPFGFSYRYPDRLKIQYISIPFTEAEQIARKKLDDYDWKKEAWKQYSQNPGRYQTEKKEKPSTQGFDMSSPTTEPTTKPFEEVSATIISALVDEKARAIQLQILSRLSDRLNADYTTYQQNSSATFANNPLGSFEYLQGLRDAIQQEFGVVPVIETVAEFRSQEELAQLPNIGRATLNDEPFANYAMNNAPGIVKKDNALASAPLGLFKPSQALKDSAGNLFLFRIAAVDPAHKPAALSEVAERVANDWRKKTAYDSAKGGAQLLLDSAKNGSLETAAAGVNRLVIRTSAFSPNQNDRSGGVTASKIPEYPLPEASGVAFVNQAMELLTSSSPADEHPRRLIELPREGKVAVVELQSVEQTDTASDSQLRDMFMGHMIAYIGQQNLIREWFKYENIITRTRYKPTQPMNKDKDKDSEKEKKPENQMPGNPFLNGM